MQRMNNQLNIHRGDVCLVRFEGELEGAQGLMPAVCVSPSSLACGRVTVVPLLPVGGTEAGRETERVIAAADYPDWLDQDRVVSGLAVASVPGTRLEKRLGRIRDEEMIAITRILLTGLGLDGQVSVREKAAARR
jgi:mRNA-degrading endonuclease toxin of MazEF toxin-antitoxin module